MIDPDSLAKNKEYAYFAVKLEFKDACENKCCQNSSSDDHCLMCKSKEKLIASQADWDIINSII